jgi:hypothetical protein
MKTEPFISLKEKWHNLYMRFMLNAKFTIEMLVKEFNGFACLLSQTPELWMFVPCGKDGKPLIKPSEEMHDRGHSPRKGDSKYLIEYQEAEERVLFVGQEIKYYKDNKSTCIYVNSRLIGTWYSLVPKMEWRITHLEDLTDKGLTIKIR